MGFTIDVAVTPAQIATCAPATIAVVIDVLRATSTIVTAIENGARGVIPVREPDEAIAVMRRLGRERVLLCGERGSLPIAGFDLGNSPAAYVPDVVREKTLAFTTTNGTRALIETARACERVACGALRNRAAVATALLEGAGDVLLVCAGQAGALSFEDLLCAGALVSALAVARPRFERSDAARAAQTVYEANAKRLTTAIAAGRHAQALHAAGFADDIVHCSELDVSASVPIYADGMITAG